MVVVCDYNVFKLVVEVWYDFCDFFVCIGGEYDVCDDVDVVFINLIKWFVDIVVEVIDF